MMNEEGQKVQQTYDDQFLSPQKLLRQMEVLGVTVLQSGAASSAAPLQEPEIAAPTAVPSPLRRFREWLFSGRVEAVFVVITFLAMITGLVAENWLALSLLTTPAYIAAYLTGGIFGLKAGLESLRKLTIDVDLLMILAAAGAALVGAAFEGAMLLFLFSLSNVLQNFALDRTRNAIRSLMKLRPETALVRRDEQTVTLPIEEIVVDDRIIVPILLLREAFQPGLLPGYDVDGGRLPLRFGFNYNSA